MRDFDVSKFYSYTGPNYYLNKPAIVFNLYLDPDGYRVDRYEDEVVRNLPQLAGKIPSTVVDLFVDVLMEVLRMNHAAVKSNLNLYINEYSISKDEDEYVIAVQYLDEKIGKKCIYFVSDWFKAMNNDEDFPFSEGFEKLQAEFDRTLYGGPTIYSLVEAGLKRGIPVQYIYEENVFQWGYGKKHVRGRSTTFSIDGIKDTEFTMYKDMVGEFLMMCGFPTPIGVNCFDEEEIVEEAIKLSDNFKFPVVVKPVAGHKGQGVVTGIKSEEGVRKAFRNIISSAEEAGAKFDGALVQQQIYGTDHRLLAVGGKFAAALERVPAYVDGNGRDTIKTLIEIDNATEARLDNARSPLCKIKIDDDLKDYLALQGLDLDYIPKEGERITLRRVANISAGGVSINVTDKIHPENVKLVEDIAGFFNVTCLGIDVLCKDISKSWRETPGEFGIIEINAGPGVFMHLAPAIGGSVDVPGKIMRALFKTDIYSRIPIIAGNKLTESFVELLYEKLKAIKENIGLGSVTEKGIFFNCKYFHKNPKHDENIKIVLRNPKTEFAVFNHQKDDIFDFGLWHEGADIVILEDPHYAEEILKRDLLPHGYFVDVKENQVVVMKGEEVIGTFGYSAPEDKEKTIVQAIEPLLKDIIAIYE